MIKFGKSNAEYLRVKSFFYDLDKNSKYIDMASKVSAEYRKQPLRKGCVACNHAIHGVQFTLLYGVEYCVCNQCGHLNGLYQDTEEFAEFAYAEGGAGEAGIYGDLDREIYGQRVDSIYVPKAEFMCESIREKGLDPSNFTYADFGAGAGHFISAMRKLGLSDVFGYEVSPELANLANQYHNSKVVHHNNVSDLEEIAATVDADVVTMIFSLEHIIELRSFLSALTSNSRVKFFYFAVPIFNPAVFLEAVFPGVMSRILGKGHTHLFTNESINWLCEEFGLDRISEWWFGGNAFDLHRFVSVKLQSEPSSASAFQFWNDMMLPIIDDLQLAFDRQKLSSEVHLLTAMH